jgi:outer membrane protein
MNRTLHHLLKPTPAVKAMLCFALFGIGGMGISASAWAQSKTNLLESFLAAQQYDTTFAAAATSVEASKEKVLQAKSARLPTLNLAASASVSRIDIYGSSVADRNYETAGVTLSGSYPLWRPALIDGIGQAELAVRLAQASYANARQDLMLRVAQAYFDVLVAQDALASIAAQKAAISEQLAQAKREFEVGTKTILDTNEAQARFDQMLAQEAVAKGDELAKRAALSLITGLEPSTLAGLKPNAMVGRAEPADVSAWVARAEQASIGVQVAQLNADIAKLEISRNRALNGPSADLVGSLNTTRNVHSAASAARSTPTLGSVGVQLNYPIYTGGALTSKIREATLNHAKSLADLGTAKRSAGQSARTAYLGLTYGITQIAALESAYRSGQTLLDSTKLGYQVGVRINLDVLNAQQALAASATSLSKARYDTMMSGIRLKAVTAQLTEDDLRGVNEQLQ